MSLGDISETQIKEEYKQKVQNKALKTREKKLFELAEKNKKETGRKNMREKNEVTPLRDEEYHVEPDLDIVQH